MEESKVSVPGKGNTLNKTEAEGELMVLGTGGVLLRPFVSQF